MQSTQISSLFFLLGAFAAILIFSSQPVTAGEELVVQLKDFSQTEVKSGGFTLPHSARVHIVALGGGERNESSFDSDMFAYGWILDADTRDVVWLMTRDETTRDGDDRKFDGSVALPAGSYEVYFAAYGFTQRSTFSHFTINIDHRKNEHKKKSKRGFLHWLEDLFGDDAEKEWKKRSRNWGISIYVDAAIEGITMFNPPTAFDHVVYRAVQLGDNEHIYQRMTVTAPVSLRVYALGEMDYSNEPADYGWILDAKTRRRIWEMQRHNQHEAGGARKNVKYDDVVEFPNGEYTLYFITDDSHSCADWNAAPPADPMNYGITLIAHDEKAKDNVKVSPAVDEEKNVIVKLTRIGDDDLRSASFALREETQLRVYALGERSHSRRQMADYGWIINARTREKVWTMEEDRTEHAGGAQKNRMIDQVITLPKGTYTAFYQTDDSHSYNDWNASPPFDPEHWGITVTGADEHFDMANVDTRPPTVQEEGVIAQIVRVGDGANQTQPFTLQQSARVRVYALGEGQDREMYDYGWIEDADDGHVVWEMTYSMTFHAGGGRKNRMVNTTILLDKGQYRLRYVSDDSHSFGDWNTDPPDDPMMWGITLYKEQ